MRYSNGVPTTSMNPEYIVIFRCSVRVATESQSGQRTNKSPTRLWYRGLYSIANSDDIIARELRENPDELQVSTPCDV